jgi:transposase, IS5 family
VKFTKAKPKGDGSTPPCDLAIPLFGYQNHVDGSKNVAICGYF